MITRHSYAYVARASALVAYSMPTAASCAARDRLYDFQLARLASPSPSCTAPPSSSASASAAAAAPAAVGAEMLYP